MNLGSTGNDAEDAILAVLNARSPESKAEIVDEVKILGQLKYLDVWNRKNLDERIESYQMTDAKLKALSERARRES